MMRRGIGRVGRPSLIGTAARTAVVAGTATAVVGHSRNKQAEKAQQAADAQAYQDQQAMAQQQAMAEQAARQVAAEQAAAAPPPAAPAAAAPAADPIAQLKELAALKDQGILTEEEFAAQKERILGS